MRPETRLASEPDRKELAVQFVDGLLAAVFRHYVAEDRWKYNSIPQMDETLDKLAEQLLRLIDP